MITRATAAKGVLFLVITVALVLYIGAHFLGVFNFFGPKPYTVKMPIGNASGLFPRSEVDYRGVKVGEIGALELTTDGALVNLVLDGDAPKIPANLTAQVADRSAVGERYVNLLPQSDGGPYLADGDTIPAARVAVPVPVQTVLTSLNKTVSSVPLPDLQLTVSELGKAFNGLGPKLQLLLDSTSQLTTTATQTLPQTLSLIHDTKTVLATQNDLSDPIRSFSSNLRKVAQQLKDSDPDIRKIVNDGPDTFKQVDQLIKDAGPGLGRTFKEGRDLSRITDHHLRDIQSILQLYPGLAAAIPTILPGDGTAHLGLELNLGDPPPCVKGYQATIRRAGTDLTPTPINYRAFCREPLYSVTDVRGVKPGYPFVNGKPTPVQDWFTAFYNDGPAAGIFAPIPGDRHDDRHDHRDDAAPTAGSTPATTAPVTSTTGGLAGLPGGG
jgi:phospholipid/cholesterol/gamma-HCH transport system substrate-binding protein